MKMLIHKLQLTESGTKCSNNDCKQCSFSRKFLGISLGIRNMDSVAGETHLESELVYVLHISPSIFVHKSP